MDISSTIFSPRSEWMRKKSLSQEGLKLQLSDESLDDESEELELELELDELLSESLLELEVDRDFLRLLEEPDFSF